MDRNTMMVAVTGQLMGSAVLISLLVLWFRRRRPDSTVPNESMRRIETRLAEMQHALDTVAVEVERISEGQRFTTKLLSERQPELRGAEGVRAAERSGVPR